VLLDMLKFWEQWNCSNSCHALTCVMPEPGPYPEPPLPLS
jgi:hypothetical protein